MLRELVERYLDNLKNERAFDAPFLALLSAEGYSDIHFVHGVTELGKDFIAKRRERDITYQYVFQTKAGNITASEWREIKLQIFEALTSRLGHPALDRSLPLRAVLVLTGILRGTAQVDVSDFREFIALRVPNCEVVVWDREDLVHMLQKHGPENLYRAAQDVGSYGDFLRLYGDIWTGAVSVDAIEKHFNGRLGGQEKRAQRFVATMLEAQLLSDASLANGQPYVGLQSALCVLRAILYDLQDSESMSADTLVEVAINAVAESARAVVDSYEAAAATAGSFLDINTGPGLFVAYPVAISQFTDAIVLSYTFGLEEARSGLLRKLIHIVDEEPGIRHPISDRYAVSILAVVRVLMENGERDRARALLKAAAIWLIDRYWNQDGLAPCWATEAEEVGQLIGGPFSGTDVKRNDASLLACALMDAACYCQDIEIYSGLRADILAAEIVPHYYQVRDTSQQFVFAGEDVVRMPNAEFSPTMPKFEAFAHGSHLEGEPRWFKLQSLLGPRPYLAISLLLRDRYFPTTWQPLRAAGDGTPVSC